MEPLRFNVGDQVIGNARANRYAITARGTRWTVTGRMGDVIRLNNAHDVDADCFDLVEPAPYVEVPTPLMEHETTMKFPHGYKSDIKAIKDAGFTHLKIELEAQLNRSDDFYDEENCESYIREHTTRETLDTLTYMQFYDDGSVDSELTFTLPIEEAWRGIEIMNAFKSLSDANGGGLQTHRAGLHLTLLTSGEYPSETKLDSRKLANFAKQVTRLLPGLYAAATHNGVTRQLEYRRPSISPEKDGVYPAICTHGGTCLEYRIFDTCYDKPEALLEKIQIIAATLQFFHPTRAAVLKSTSFDLEDVANRYSNRLFSETIKDLKNLEALNETIAIVKPKGVSLATFKRARQLDKLTVSKVMSYTKARDLRRSIQYQAYLMDRRQQMNAKLAQWLEEYHSDATSQRAIADLMPTFTAWYYARYDKTLSFDSWIKGQSTPSPYRSPVKINLELPRKAPKGITANEYMVFV